MIESETLTSEQSTAVQNGGDQNSVRSGQGLFDYLLILARHKKVILGTTFAVALCTAALSLLLSNIYTARTLILPVEEEKGIMGAMMAQMGGLAAISGDAIGSKTKADLYVTILKSETIMDSMIDRFKLMDAYDVKYRTSAYRMLSRNTKITVGKKDGVVTISVDDKDPKIAATMANEYVTALAKFTISFNSLGAGNNRIFLEKRIAETRANLASAEEALRDFQVKNKSISVPDQAKASIEGVSQLRGQLAAQEVQLATLRLQFAESSQEVKTAKATIANLRSQVAAMEGNGGESSSVPTVGSIPGIGQQYIRLMRDFKIHEAILETLVKQYEVASLSESKDVPTFQVIQVAKAPELKSKPSRSKIVIVAVFLAFVISSVVVCMRELVQQLPDAEGEKMRQVIGSLDFTKMFKVTK